MPLNIVTEDIEKENMRQQRRLKIATLAISGYALRLMCLKIKMPEYYKICRVLQRKTTNYIPTLVKSFIIWFLTSSCRKTEDKGFGVFEECTNRSKCKESSCIDQLAALQVET